MRFVAEKVTNREDREGGGCNKNLHNVQTHKHSTCKNSALKFCQILEEFIVAELFGTVSSHEPVVLPSANTWIRSFVGKIIRTKPKF